MHECSPYHTTSLHHYITYTTISLQTYPQSTRSRSAAQTDRFARTMDMTQQTPCFATLKIHRGFFARHFCIFGTIKHSDNQVRVRPCLCESTATSKGNHSRTGFCMHPCIYKDGYCYYSFCSDPHDNQERHALWLHGCMVLIEITIGGASRAWRCPVAFFMVYLGRTNPL